MCRLSVLFRRRQTGLSIFRMLVLLPLLCCRLSAQNTVTVPNASFALLQTALAHRGGAETLNVILAFNGTITVTSPLVIATNTILDAPSNTVTLAGAGGVRLFKVSSNVMFTVKNMTLSGGNSAGASGAIGSTGSSGVSGNPGGSGGNGGNGLGGAIYNQGTNWVINCLLLTNSVTGGAGGAGGAGGNGSITTGGDGGTGGNGGLGYGGAIYNLGTLLLSNSTLAGNSATGGAGGS